MSIIDLVGQRYGRLVVIERAEDQVFPSGNRKAKWLCRCDCGETVTVLGCHLRSGNTNSCGCLQREMSAQRNTTHGHRKGSRVSPEYKAWADMLTRCYNPNQQHSRYYGGRGITVCQEWRESFENFLADMGPHPGKGYSLERDDVNGPYCQQNCRWATQPEQSRNKRNNIWVTYNGQRMVMTDAAKAAGLKKGTLLRRIKCGWPESDLFVPVRPRQRSAPAESSGK